MLAQGQGMVKLARSDELEILVGVPEHRLKTVRDASQVTFELWSDTGHKYARQAARAVAQRRSDDPHLSGALHRGRRRPTSSASA